MEPKTFEAPASSKLGSLNVVEKFSLLLESGIIFEETFSRFCSLIIGLPGASDNNAEISS